jgi:WD40 repeat protein
LKRPAIIALALCAALPLAAEPAPAKVIPVDGQIVDLAYGTDGSKIVCGYRNILNLFSTDGSLVKRFGIKEGADIDVLDYSAGIIASYAYTNPAQIMLWDESGKNSGKLGAIAKDADETTVNPSIETAKAYRLRFTRGGKGIVTVSSTENFGGVKLWNLASGTATPLKGYDDTSVYGCAFSPDGSRFATISRDEKVIIWDASNGAAIATIETGDPLEPTYNGKDIAFLADGSLVVLKQDVSVWSSAGKQVKTLENAGESAPLLVRASRDGSMFAVAYAEGGFALFSKDGKRMGVYSTGELVPAGISFSPDSKSVAVALNDENFGKGEIRIYSIK